MKPRWAGVNPALVGAALKKESMGRTAKSAVQVAADSRLPAAAVSLERQAPRHKYSAKKTECSHRHMHDSKHEASRCDHLHLLEKAGNIRELTLTPAWDLVVEGMSVGRYVADFGYMENGVSITEDAKGVRTPVYRLKKKLMLAIYGIDIRET